MPPTRADRVIAAVAVAIVSMLVVWLNAKGNPGSPTDFDQVWFGAKMLWEGRSPYALIGPGREFDYRWQFYYPLSASVVVAPLGLLPLVTARLVFAGVSGALLTYYALADGWSRMLLFVSRAYFVHLLYLQWTVLLTAALFAPWLGLVAAAKPNVGGATAAAQRSWRSLAIYVGAGALPVLVSLVLQPGWPLEWLVALRSSDHFRPIVAMPGGFLLLLAALRWRRWEGRLLLALACIPQTHSTMSILPLLLIPKTWRGTGTLVALSYLAAWSSRFVLTASMTFPETMDVVARLLLWIVYLPALGFVLRLPARPEPAGRS